MGNRNVALTSLPTQHPWEEKKRKRKKGCVAAARLYVFNTVSLCLQAECERFECKRRWRWTARDLASAKRRTPSSQTNQVIRTTTIRKPRAAWWCNSNCNIPSSTSLRITLQKIWTLTTATKVTPIILREPTTSRFPPGELTFIQAPTSTLPLHLLVTPAKRSTLHPRRRHRIRRHIPSSRLRFLRDLLRSFNQTPARTPPPPALPYRDPSHRFCECQAGKAIPQQERALRFEKCQIRM